jgi:tripartite-type tricarboxylate transporter receptor subunit TctC
VPLLRRIIRRGRCGWVGFGPGASGDIAARVLAQKLGQILGQQFIVENRTGAASNIATNYVAKAPKDGYTLLQATVANTISAALTPNLPYDLIKDLVLSPRCRTSSWCTLRSASRI